MMSRRWPDYTSVFLVSAGALVTEIVLTRIFSVTFWYHFASLLIALALTGFGCAGSLLALAMPRLKNHMPISLKLSAAGAALLTLLAYWGVWALDLEPLNLAWRPTAWFKLALVCALLILPFFLAAAHIALGLARSTRPRLTYAANLAGAGLGCLAAAGALDWLLPQRALYLGAGLFLAGFMAQCLESKKQGLLWPATLAGALIISLLVWPLPLRFADFKDRSSALAAKGSRLISQEVGIRGIVEVIGGPAFHFAPGLSLSCSLPLPKQMGLFIDGDLAGPISKTVATGGPAPWADCLLLNLAFKPFRPQSLLLLDAGGGLSLLPAGPDRDIVVLEDNPQVLKLWRGLAKDYGKVFSQRAGLNLVRQDPVTYLNQTGPSFDLIMLGQGVRWSAGSATGLGVSRLLTGEGLETLLKRLTPRGALAFSGPIMRPPRAGLKLMVTSARVLRGLGRNPADCLALVRDWNTALILVKPAGFSRFEIKALKTLAHEGSFDFSALPGLKPSELNRFHHLPGEPLATAWRLITQGKEEHLFSRSPFNLRPATRDRPYFFHFFKPGSLKLLLSPEQGRALAVTQWGLLFVWVGLMASLLLAALGIFPPLFHLRPRPGGSLFFAALGLAYMLAEITLLAEVIYLLGRPALSLPLVVGTFLLLSGLGSMLFGQRRPAGFALASAVSLMLAFAALRLGEPGELGVALILAPAALLMGAPFAGGLTHLAGPSYRARAWAFGINGFFSVAGSLGATLICLQAGHMAALSAAAVCYLGAALLSREGRK